MLRSRDTIRRSPIAHICNFHYRLAKQKAGNMRWTSSSFMNGMHTLFRGHSGNRTKDAKNSIPEIREAMLRAMGNTASAQFPVIQLRVTYADDIQDLWYLRGDVLAAIASFDGEVLAREKIANISELFVGLVPNSLTSKSALMKR
jgi:hypothetical protein